MLLLEKLNEKISDQWNELALKEFFIQMKEGKVERVQETLHMLRKVDGISLWKINWRLNRLARSGLSKEMLQSGKIIIYLPEKNTGESISPYDKKYIEKLVDELEGMEFLRLCHFYSYKPVYMEKKIFNHVTRWIEIEVIE